jgi:hypothetical protein
MSVKFKKRYLVLLGLAGFFVLWRLLTPWVIVNYSSGGRDVLNILWDVNHRIYRGDLAPGRATSDKGDIFVGGNFFMVFFWWDNKGLDRCMSITPKIGGTINIYLDASAEIDTSKTSPEVVGRMKACDREPDPYRP